VCSRLPAWWLRPWPLRHKTLTAEIPLEFHLGNHVLAAGSVRGRDPEDGGWYSGLSVYGGSLGPVGGPDGAGSVRSAEGVGRWEREGWCSRASTDAARWLSSGPGLGAMPTASAVPKPGKGETADLRRSRCNRARANRPPARGHIGRGTNAAPAGRGWRRIRAWGACYYSRGYAPGVEARPFPVVNVLTHELTLSFQSVFVGPGHRSGTATPWSSQRQGDRVNEPSIVAINKKQRRGGSRRQEAKDMLGRTPGNIVAIKPDERRRHRRFQSHRAYR